MNLLREKESMKNIPLPIIYVVEENSEKLNSASRSMLIMQ